MRELPILLNAEMVRAVLDGSKTQTRRIAPISRLKIEPFENGMVTWSVYFSKPIKGVTGSYSGGRVSESQAMRVIASQFCPFGAVGDRLWVREKTRVDLLLNNRRAHVRYEADGEYRIVPVPERIKPVAEGRCMSNGCYREASRITLEITGVRVERLRDISEADAAAEGVPPAGDLLPDHPGTYLTPKGDFATAKVAFQRLWESIYGEESWQANPFVWVLEFKRVGEVGI